MKQKPKTPLEIYISRFYSKIFQLMKYCAGYVIRYNVASGSREANLINEG